MHTFRYIVSNKLAALTILIRMLQIRHPVNSCFQLCSIISDQKLICPSPSTASFTRRRRQIYQNDIQIGFEMDGVQSVQDIKTNFPDVESVIEIHKDPILDEFKNKKKVYRGQQEGQSTAHLVLEVINIYMSRLRSESAKNSKIVPHRSKL